MSDSEDREITWVDWLLGAGIVFFPLVFYWFLFRSKYTVKERVIAGIYTGVIFIFWLASVVSAPDRNAHLAAESARPPRIIEEIRPAPAPTPTISAVATVQPYLQQQQAGSVVGVYGQNASSGATGGPAMQVESIDLAQAFQDNEVAAKMQYGGKTLYVDGTVTGVTLDFMDNPVIELEGVNQFLPVHASFDKSYTTGISQVQKGQRIRVVCRKIGEVISAPMLNDCSF